MIDGMNRAGDRESARTEGELAKELKGFKDAAQRSLRLATLKASIEAGAYHVSTDALADCLMRRLMQPR